MIVVQQAAVATPSSDSTTTVQQIVNCTSQDVRAVLAASGSDLPILVDYINRISLQILRFSRWRFLLSGIKQFTTTAGTSDYWFGTPGGQPGGSVDTGLNIQDLFTVKRDSVIDRSNFHRLGFTEAAPIGQQFAQNGKPKIWRNDVSTPFILSIYPPPDQAYTIEFRYYKVRTQLTDISQILQIPDNYKDVVCAGVNWLAYKYLSKDEDAQHWFQTYSAGKIEIIKDANLFPRGEEFIRPDPSTLVRQTTTGIGLDSGLETSIP